MKWRDVFIGFGANVGEPVSQVREALDRLCTSSGVRCVRVSSLYRTEPVGWEEQDWFVNGVVQIETTMGARRLMKLLLEIEEAMARVRTRADGPRNIDLDLLLFEDRVIDDRDLQVPHPRMHERRFVLVPLGEIAPDFRHPVLGRSISELRESLSDGKIVERIGRIEPT
jgi:2-amino-4-hydroxy-6-hydroxymethyldihydropteridine diphosphokinase